MNTKFISAVMVLVVTFSFGYTTVHADVASDKAKIQQVQAQRNDLENKIMVMDNQIETIMFKINDNESNITKTQNNIQQSQIDIAKAEDDIKAETALFDQRVRAMYISGSSSSYIDIVLGSKNIDDLISRVENIKKIITYNRDIITDLKTKKAAIDLKKAALYAENAKLLSLKADNENKLADLTKQKSDQTVLISQLKSQESQYGSQLEADQAAALAASVAAVAKIRAEAPSIKKSASKSTGSTFTGSTASSAPGIIVSRGTAFSPDSVIAYASNFLGIPYVWGGTTTSGFDCSGFTQYVFAHFGIGLPRVAADQQNVGTYVSRADLKTGDLVFFGDPAHHVGIYVGDGDMINAPHTGDVVRIQPLFSDFTYGRRVN